MSIPTQNVSVLSVIFFLEIRGLVSIGTYLFFSFLTIFLQHLCMRQLANTRKNVPKSELGIEVILISLLVVALVLSVTFRFSKTEQLSDTKRQHIYLFDMSSHGSGDLPLRPYSYFPWYTFDALHGCLPFCSCQSGLLRIVKPLLVPRTLP